MASVKIGIIIGVILASIIGITLLSLSGTNYDNEKIPQNVQKDSSEIEESEEHDFYINEEGKKILVIKAKDSLQIDD